MKESCIHTWFLKQKETELQHSQGVFPFRSPSAMETLPAKILNNSTLPPSYSLTASTPLSGSPFFFPQLPQKLPFNLLFFSFSFCASDLPSQRSLLQPPFFLLNSFCSHLFVCSTPPAANFFCLCPSTATLLSHSFCGFKKARLIPYGH